MKKDVIRILECCGFHARNGLKVLEQRSLITIYDDSDDDGELVVGMHDHIEEMGKNIVRREHPDEPKKHSRLWIKEEIEDILDNDMGTKATRCLKLWASEENSQIHLKSFGKMKKLRYLELDLRENPYFHCKSDIPNSLKYLKCSYYPFLYLPKRFQANNLVGLEIYDCHRMIQLWEDEGKKVLKNLKFLSLIESNLTTFDFTITPNLESLTLGCVELKELCMPTSCQKLTYLYISFSNITTFDLGLTPNLKTLTLDYCPHFVKLQVSASCPNLKILNLVRSRLKSLDLELIPNLESLDLSYCYELVEINPPVGCLEKVVYLILCCCYLLEKLPEDLGRSGCLKELDILYTGISHLPQSIFGLKGLIIAASKKLLQRYDFPSEITTTSDEEWRWDLEPTSLFIANKRIQRRRDILDRQLIF